MGRPGRYPSVALLVGRYDVGHIAGRPPQLTPPRPSLSHQLVVRLGRPAGRQPRPRGRPTNQPPCLAAPTPISRRSRPSFGCRARRPPRLKPPHPRLSPAGGPPGPRPPRRPAALTFLASAAPAAGRHCPWKSRRPAAPHSAGCLGRPGPWPPLSLILQPPAAAPNGVLCRGRPTGWRPHSWSPCHPAVSHLAVPSLGRNAGWPPRPRPSR